MIRVDSRVGSKELVRYFPSTCSYELCQLPSADFAFEGDGPNQSRLQIGIERKTIPDLIQSIQSKRLVGYQIPNLVRDFSRVYLLVEGIWRPNKDSGIIELFNGSSWNSPFGSAMMAKDVKAFLYTLQELCNVRLLMCSCPDDSVKTVIGLFNWWNKPYEEHQSHTSIHMDYIEGTILSRPTTLMRVAAQLPGIGSKKAKAVSKHFSSILEMSVASEQDWMQVEGIGKATAAKLVKVIQGDNS